MIERVREAAGKDWAKSFINSLSTVLLGLLVAWVTGFLELKSVVAMQTVQLKSMETKMDERTREFITLQLNGSLKDSHLEGELNVIKNQHEAMLKDVDHIKIVLEKKK